jgi:hypothetical protein
MIVLQKLDTVMYEAQRQGRISFYMPNSGETAAQLGSAHALDINDLVFGKTLIFEQNFNISNPTSKVCEFSGSVILKFTPKTLTFFRLKVAKIFIFRVIPLCMGEALVNIVWLRFLVGYNFYRLKSI